MLPETNKFCSTVTLPVTFNVPVTSVLVLILNPVACVIDAVTEP